MRRFVLNGLKALNMTAQGNALGNTPKNILRPEGARQFFHRDFVPPFQGGNFFIACSQGVALGYHVIAPSARGILISMRSLRSLRLNNSR